MISHLPTPSRELYTAAQELLCALAELCDPHYHGIQAPPYAHGREVLGRAMRALVGLSHFEGGPLMLAWSPALSLNQHPLPSNDRANEAARALRQNMSARGVDGLVFRYLPEEDQLLYFFRRLRTMARADFERLGRPRQLATLSGERDLLGFQLLLGDPHNSESPREVSNPQASGLGARTAFETVLRDTDLDWVGQTRLPDEEGPLSPQARQRLALSVYVNLTSTTLRFARMARDLQQARAALPFLSLHRLVQQLDLALQLVPDLLQACVLLGARDPSPARRLAHTALLAVALGRTSGASPLWLAELGLAAFVYGLVERGRRASREEQSLDLLRFLQSEESLTPLKLRALHAAALALQPRWHAEEPPPEPSETAKLTRLAADCAAALDGTDAASEGGEPASDPPPLPALLAMERLKRVRLDGALPPPGYTLEHLALLARWWTPLPVGSVVRLRDGATAVIAPHPELVLCALPLLDAQGAILEPPAPARPLYVHGVPDQAPLDGLMSPLPVVDLAARALFPHAQDLWGPFVHPLTP